MSEVSFTTSQNVTIDYEIASLGDRIFAYIIDSLVKAGYILFFFFIALKLDNNLKIMANPAVLFVLALPVLFYSLIFELAMNGQTPGKRVRQIRVVRLDGMQPALGAYLLRWLFRLVDFSIMSGLIAVIVHSAGGKGQRLGDIVAKTCVIKTKDRIKLKDTIYENVNEEYQITYLEVSRLSEKDIEIIKKVLYNKTYSDRPEIIDPLVDQIAGKMEVQPVSPDKRQFLETVVKDFNRYIGGL